jgi:hypothetical protein
VSKLTSYRGSSFEIEREWVYEYGNFALLSIGV